MRPSEGPTSAAQHHMLVFYDQKGNCRLGLTQGYLRQMT